MHRLRRETAHLPSIAVSQHMPRGNPLNARFDRAHLLGILRQLRNRRLRILQLPQFLGNKLPQLGILNRHRNLDVIRHSRHASAFYFRSGLRSAVRHDSSDSDG